MSIQNALNTGIYSRLSSGTALTSLLGGTAIYYAQAPNNTAMPFVLWDITESPDTNRTSNRNVTAIVFIRGYASTPLAAGSIDAAIYDEMMKGVTVSGWTEYWKSREEGFATDDTDEAGITTYISGAHYRLAYDKN